MANPKISIGDDTATGEPANGPKGPYITDDSDDELGDAERGSRKADPKKILPGTAHPTVPAGKAPPPRKTTVGASG